MALLTQRRTAELDAAYRLYDDHPIGERDEGGDLESFRRAACSS